MGGTNATACGISQAVYNVDLHSSTFQSIKRSLLLPQRCYIATLICVMNKTALTISDQVAS